MSGPGDPRDPGFDFVPGTRGPRPQSATLPFLVMFKLSLRCLSMTRRAQLSEGPSCDGVQETNGYMLFVVALAHAWTQTFV